MNLESAASSLPKIFDYDFTHLYYNLQPHGSELDLDTIRSEQQLDLSELPHVDEADYAEPDLPSIFSDEHFKSTLVTSLTDSKIDSRLQTSRVVQDAMTPVETRAAHAAILDPGGHISRAKGITINGNVKVKPVKKMYASYDNSGNKVDYAEDLKLYNSHKAILNPEWDHNFVADGTLSSDKFKRKPTSHLLKSEITNYVSKIFSSPSMQEKRGVFKTRYKDGSRPTLIMESRESNEQNYTTSKHIANDKEEYSGTTKNISPTKKASLHHHVSASLPSVKLFGSSIDDNDSDINFRMTDSIEIAANEYGAYSSHQAEDNLSLPLRGQKTDVPNTFLSEEKNNESVAHSKIDSPNSSAVVTQESSSVGRIFC